MSIQKDIAELISEGVISTDIGEKISGYYEGKKSKGNNRLFAVFGVLGAVLVGLGIILIIAHNWDNLSRNIKTTLAFVPLVIGQIACLVTILRFKESTAWREGSAVFLFFSVGAVISLISQIYHIPGDLGGFLFIWMILCLPLIYLLNSSITSILYLIGITAYGCYVEYWSSVVHIVDKPISYWILIIGVLPQYFLLYRNRPASNSIVFHHWFVPLSVIILLGSVSTHPEEYIFISYASFYGLLYFIGQSQYFKGKSSIFNGYKVLGYLGMLVLLYILSFSWFWDDLSKVAWNNVVPTSGNFWLAVSISIVTLGLIGYQKFRKRDLRVNPFELAILIIFILGVIGTLGTLAQIIVNLLILSIAIFEILEGVRSDHLGTLNFGLLIIAVLVTCRFFDVDLSFIVRGSLFVLVGAGFFISNYMLLKKRRSADE